MPLEKKPTRGISKIVSFRTYGEMLLILVTLQTFGISLLFQHGQTTCWTKTKQELWLQHSKQQIQKIIIDLYKLDNNNYDWKSIEMDAPTFNEEEVLHGNYQINTIDRIADKETLGKISKVPIPV